ncbi:MAG: hypothetical protein ACREBY_14790 [Polaromonas sp.]
MKIYIAALALCCTAATADTTSTSYYDDAQGVYQSTTTGDFGTVEVYSTTYKFPDGSTQIRTWVDTTTTDSFNDTTTDSFNSTITFE